MCCVMHAVGLARWWKAPIRPGLYGSVRQASILDQYQKEFVSGGGEEQERRDWSAHLGLPAL